MARFSALVTDSLSLCYCSSMNYGGHAAEIFTSFICPAFCSPVESNDHAPLRPDLRGHRCDHQETGEDCDCRRLPPPTPSRRNGPGGHFSFRTSVCRLP